MNQSFANPRPGHRGFTLMEMVMAITLVGIVGALAAPRYANSLNSYRANLAAKRVAADLAMARSNAWASGAHRTATFTTATNSYVLAGIRGLNQATTDCTVSLSAEPYYALVNSVNFEGQSSVTFDGYGQPNRGGTVVIRAGTFQKTVTLDRNSGIVSVQ